ncbi:GIY-YIG nuclease family protein [Arthrospiribacter ruber]|uniref:GIY-YIG nuclease family protein n=1 Tax=Arthrospiribacter ruber TaxID=2487934 RepID=A0A951IZG1_9BACT|nr:GIY-YIG nuclease family protein [Arthrospiribacter ruber]MBW3469708.1 GIY-YIG nuclease family protein [Arthrospiribacter ruber]
MKRHEYFVYILTNYNKTVLYVGMTNDLSRRLSEHVEKFNPDSFTVKYRCKYLLFWEQYQYVREAIAREKEIKGWRRSKKDLLVSEFNPDWRFLNEDVLSN